MPQNAIPIFLWIINPSRVKAFQAKERIQATLVVITFAAQDVILLLQKGRP